MFDCISEKQALLGLCWNRCKVFNLFITSFFNKKKSFHDVLTAYLSSTAGSLLGICLKVVSEHSKSKPVINMQSDFMKTAIWFFQIEK